MKMSTSNGAQGPSMKLTLELIPSTAWLHSLHRYLTDKAWTNLRQSILDKNGTSCSVCGATNVRLDCNEQWEFDDKTHIQRLVGLVMLCQMCHLTVHMMERGSITNDVLAEHFMKVNGCSREEFEVHYQQCLEEQARREFDQYTTGCRVSCYITDSHLCLYDLIR